MVARRVTWAELVARKPRLRDLLAELRGLSPPPDFCANALWYAVPQGYRERLSALVGWGVADPILGSSDAYDVTYDTLYGALPDCQHAGGCDPW